MQNDPHRTNNRRYYILNVEIKGCNVMIDGKNVFDQPISSMTKTYKNIRKNATGRGDVYTNDCLLNYTYFKKYYKIIDINLSKQQALDADPKAIQ